MVTRFRSIQNEEHSIPNASVLAQGVTNLTAAARKKGLAIRVGAGIGYDVDWRQVHSLMTGAKDTGDSGRSRSVCSGGSAHGLRGQL